MMPDIDLVVLWVDGSDPDWLAEKKKYAGSVENDGNAVYRFRDFGLMKYWFRAVESFLPWVNRIHFVTWGHLPPFLNVSHPKLNIVRHQDYMPEDCLPCFNSSALEMNLFRIHGLSEHFIFFNDDMFVLRSMEKKDFFTEKGLPCCQFTELPLTHRGNRGLWLMHCLNDISIINQDFSKRQCLRRDFHKYYSIKYDWRDNVRSLAMRYLFPQIFTGFKIFHVATPFCKKTFETIWEKETELLQEVSHHKFRDYTDVNQWLAVWWQMAEGNFYPRRMDTKSILLNYNNIDQICSWIRNQTFEMLCINDDVEERHYAYIVKRISDAFESVLPDKSSFEI